jgi:hypothetical protein
MNLTGIAEHSVTIASAGAIPLLVQLLGRGSTTDMKNATVGLLTNLALSSADIACSVVAAGAVPPLVTLLGTGRSGCSRTHVQHWWPSLTTLQTTWRRSLLLVPYLHWSFCWGLALLSRR